MMVLVWVLLSIYLFVGIASSVVLIWGDWKEIKVWPYVILYMSMYFCIAFFMIPMVLLSWIFNDNTKDDYIENLRKSRRGEE